MFSATMSAFLIISLTISSPFGDFRFNVIDFLLTLNWWKYHGSSSGLPGRSRLPGSPRPGFSILITSAPNQPNTSVEVVPASNCVKSTTLTPCRKLKSWTLSLIARVPPVAHRSWDTACAFPRRTATLSRHNDVLQLGSAADDESRWRNNAGLHIDEASGTEFPLHLCDFPYMATTARDS